MWDEAVLMGKQGHDEITVRDIAALKKSVTYDVLTNWRLRPATEVGERAIFRAGSEC